MNIYDISNKAGVSTATVSRVINGNSYVSEKTRKKVLDVIEECGYTPNAFARGLGHNTMNIIGIMCADSSDPYLATAIFYLQKELRKNNYDSLLCCTGYELEAKINYMKLLLNKRTDAIILVGSNYIEANDKKNQYIRDAAKEVPLLIINGALKGENIFCTLGDDRHAVFDATKTLYASGLHNILYLYNSVSYSGKEKLSGYLDAMNIENTSAAIKTNEYIQYCNGNFSEVKNHLISLHKMGLNFDAVMASDDILAVGALKYALEYGIQVPEQLSIIGYNNSIISQCSNPELTSIDNKLEAVCLQSISSLMNVFRGLNAPSKTLFAPEIIKRGTTQF